jgi:hypothetical protein
MKATGPAPVKRRRWWVFGASALALAVAVVLIVVFVFVRGGPAYRVKYVSVQSLGLDATRIVMVVKNTGTATGTPTCTIRASAIDHAGSGAGSFIENRPIKPGSSNLYVNTLKVSDAAANLVKSSGVSVACHTAAR